MRNMILQDDLSGVVDRRLHCRKLYEHLAAVPPVLHHALDGFQVPDGTRDAVQHGFHMLRVVRVAVRPVRVCVCAVMRMRVCTVMRMRVYAVMRGG